MAMDPKIIERGFGFAIFPSVFLKGRDKIDPDKLSWTKQLLFGDWIGLECDDSNQPVFESFGDKQYLKVRARGKSGYVLPGQIQFDRVLEVNFVDVGQGDGCHLVTPDDKHFLIDAGESDNMYRFLTWRFNLKKENSAPRPFTTIISHSDKDHYFGFNKIFDKAGPGKMFDIEKVYHNGMIETTGKPVATLGTPIDFNGQQFITDLCDENVDYLNRITHCRGQYSDLLRKTDAPKIALRKGSEPIYDNGNLIIEVLGPVATDINGKACLPVFGENDTQKGKTKNGHSVILKLTIGKLTMLLGGDLNELSEDYILKEYTQIDVAAHRKILASSQSTQGQRDAARQQIETAVTAARIIFQSDIAKSCHHGSGDFTTEFLRAVNPLATIISSGDAEPHAHPRPDTLGTIGKHSRGERSLIFCTELARSTSEFVTIKKSDASQDVVVPVPKKANAMTRTRAVTVYGMINVRTDGNNVVIAQRLEEPAPRGEWDIHELLWDKKSNEFVYKL